MDNGRPPLYNNTIDFENKVDEYFEFGHEIRKVLVGSKDSKELVDMPVFTITGLALFLGFESRQSLYDYSKKDGFSYIVKKAQLRIENMYEGQLQSGAPTGAIFALKNMGWRDSQHIDQTNTGELTIIRKTIE